MLIAFLTDLRMIRSSGGKSGSTDALKELFDRHKLPAARIEADAAVKNIVGAEAFQKFILEAQPIDWTPDTASAGLESARTGRTFQLRVSAKPDGRQRAILKRLGYN